MLHAPAHGVQEIEKCHWNGEEKCRVEDAVESTPDPFGDERRFLSARTGRAPEEIVAIEQKTPRPRLSLSKYVPENTDAYRLTTSTLTILQPPPAFAIVTFTR